MLDYYRDLKKEADREKILLKKAVKKGIILNSNGQIQQFVAALTGLSVLNASNIIMKNKFINVGKNPEIKLDII